MASPGPAPPCVQAVDQRESRAPARPTALTGERVSPRAPPQRPRFGVGRPRPRLTRSGIGPGERSEERPPFTFIAPLGLVSPMTRTHVRLLGPCFKTGRVGHRPFARRERKGVSPSLLHDRRRAARTPEVSPFALVTRRRGTNPSGPSTSPAATGRGDLHHGGKYARRRRLGCGHAQECPGRLSESRTRPT